MSVSKYNRDSTLSQAPISATTSGAKALVGAIPGSEIVIVKYVLTTDAEVKVKFQSGSADLTGPMTLAAKGHGLDSGRDKEGHFWTAPGEALNLHQSGNAGIGGYLLYFRNYVN